MARLNAAAIAEYLEIALEEERQLADEYQDAQEAYYDSGEAELNDETRQFMEVQ